jgi:hypothetical protein
MIYSHFEAQPPKSDTRTRPMRMTERMRLAEIDTKERLSVLEGKITGCYGFRECKTA